MSNSEFSVDAVRKHQETVVSALKVSVMCLNRMFDGDYSVGSDFAMYLNQDHLVTCTMISCGVTLQSFIIDFVATKL